MALTRKERTTTRTPITIIRRTRSLVRSRPRMNRLICPSARAGPRCRGGSEAALNGLSLARPSPTDRAYLGLFLRRCPSFPCTLVRPAPSRPDIPPSPQRREARRRDHLCSRRTILLPTTPTRTRRGLTICCLRRERPPIKQD